MTIKSASDKTSIFVGVAFILLASIIGTGGVLWKNFVEYTGNSSSLPDVFAGISEQPPYNLTDRRAEMELVWTAQRYGLALMPFGPLAGGVLSGVYRKGEPIPEGHQFQEVGQRDGHRRLTEETLDLVEALIPLAEARGVSLAEFALAWCAAQPGITSPITGPRTAGHVESALRAAEVELTAEELARVDGIIPPGTAVTRYFTIYDRMVKATTTGEPLGPF